MNSGRYFHGNVYLYNKIWAIGGIHSKRSMKSVEFFCFIKNKWYTTSSLNQTRSQINPTVIGSKIYVIGGEQNMPGVHSTYLNSIEVLDVS